MHIFDDVMEPGIDLIEMRLNDTVWRIPDYLSVNGILRLSINDKVNPANLPPSTAIIYNRNLYLTDEKGKVAFIDCQLKKIENIKDIRKSHPEYHSVGGKNATHPNMDAGHFGLALGQHPSIAMEQNSTMNRYGIWRVFERYWSELSENEPVHIIGVFTEGDDEGTYSPFWCIREEYDGGVFEYVFTNDDEQS